MHAPINVKTTYTFLSSVIEVDDLINYAVTNKIDYLFICDKNMYGTMEFIRKCQLNNIMPIIGVDFGDLLLFAKNYEGYQNLLKLSTISTTNALTFDDYLNYKDNLIAIFMTDDALLKYKDIYDDYYIDYRLNCDGKKVFTKEVLSFDKNKLHILKCLNLLRDNKTVSDDYTFNEDCMYDDEQYLDNLMEMVHKCSFKLVDYHLNLPNYNSFNDTKGLSSEEYLYNLSVLGLTRRLGNNVNSTYKNRLLYELDIINKMGFANYFLIVYDFIKYAKTNGILVGPGRGSACGCLVSYSLGITEIDPIRYNLLFERFLNIERITMPDIDTDFPDNKRDDVIDYVVSKYGLKRVSGITTFGTFGSKMAIRDIGRVLNVPLVMVDEICKMLGKDESTLKDSLKNNIKLKGLIDSNNKLKSMYEIASSIEGMKRHTSIHAAGILLSNDDLDNYVPLVFNDGMYLSAYEASYLEDLGLLKMDFLGLRNLTIIDDIIKNINSKLSINLKFSNIPLNDAKTFELFQNGETQGIFQFESMGMRTFLKEMHPDSFMDLANANALYRPGPSANIPLYIKRKKGLLPVDYYDESLKDILSDTYGIIVYQEQIMQIANKMASYTLGEADILRRAMSKKKLELLVKEKDKFIEGAINNQYSREVAIKVFDLILSFASYGFNKSHSIAYTMIAYKMAYLKTNYPLYFYLAILNNGTLDNVKTNEYLKELKRMNIKVLKPDINKSYSDYKIYYNNIILPFTKIKGVSKTIATKIVEIREDGFSDIYDFFSKMVKANFPKNIYEVLINSDSLKCFNYNHQTLINNLETLINYGNLTKDLGSEFVLKPEITFYDEYDKMTLIENEKELFGMYLTNHPVMEYKLKNDNCINLCDVSKYFNKYVETIVLVDSVKEIKTKKGDAMLFVKASDEEESLDFVLFPETYRKYGMIEKGSILKLGGKVEKRNGFQIIVSKVERF